jgi:YfiH family protein
MGIIDKEGVSYAKAGDAVFNVAFLTRKDGFSASPYDSLNMSYAGGDDKSCVDMNYDKVFTAFGLERERLISIKQVHGSDVLIIKRSGEGQVGTGDFDAVVTDDTSLCLSILTADCVPIFLYDGEKGVFAAVHAGWRGTALGIAKKAVNVMEREFLCDPCNIGAALGPAIGSCCYEIKREVLNKLIASVDMSADGMYRLEGDKVYPDLKKINIAQLKECGVKDEMISSADYCTSCSDDLFFSFRRDNVTGRQLSFVTQA